MGTLELLRETTQVGLTFRFLDRLVERVEEIARRAETRREDFEPELRIAS